MISSTCYHTGYHLLRYLRPLAEESVRSPDQSATILAQFDSFVGNFCDKYDQVLPQRTAFVRSLKDVQTEDAFQEACYDQLGSMRDINDWFDPIDPISSITQKEISDLHFKLFASLRQKQRTSLAEHVSFSYIASLNLYLNAQEQEDFENCVNRDVIDHPSEWVTDFVSKHPAFKNWDTNAKLSYAADVASAVESQCAGHLGCDACSIAIPRIFKEYQAEMNREFSAYFTAHSESMFTALNDANLSLETA